MKNINPSPRSQLPSRLDKPTLSWLDNSVGGGSGMSPSNHAINREILIEIRKYFGGTRNIAPVPHQIANDREKTNDLDTRMSHPIVGDVTDKCRRATRCLGIGPNRIPFGAKRQGQMGCTNISHNASHDDLSPVCSFDGVAEVFVVPGINFTLTLDKSCIWIHFRDFFRQWPIGSYDILLVLYVGMQGAFLTLFGRSRQDNWQIKQLSNSGVANDALFVSDRVKVSNSIVKADLQINDKENL